MVAHRVGLTGILGGQDSVEEMRRQVIAVKGELERLREEKPERGYLPAVIIVNSVVDAIRLEDRLVESGFRAESLAIIRGLSHRAIRDTRCKVLALGTSAIEVGVDFHCDYLFFEAFEAASFLQRLGRVGRHGPGRAIALLPPNAFQGMASLGGAVDRSTLEERIQAWYPSADARPWFAGTDYGMITARSLGENLIRTVAKDARAKADVLESIRGRLDAILEAHAARLGCEAENQRGKRVFERCAAGKEHARWVEAYCGLNRFRTSMPSVCVHDFSEQRRRGDWGLGDYDADLPTLLKRGTGLAWNEKLQRLTIRGIGKYRRVHASEIFDDEDCGQILETSNFPKLRLYQDGESTPISDLMSRENHVFAVVRKSDVEGRIDWGLPVFESGCYVLAFDGAALLLLEIARKAKQDRPA